MNNKDNYDIELFMIFKLVFYYCFIYVYYLMRIVICEYQSYSYINYYYHFIKDIFIINTIIIM